MKRLAGLVLASSLALGTMLSMGRAALATPFADVPANHWAYQAIQSLAADGLIDGYPDGKFKGDRPMTRYEMAIVVARVIAKLQENQNPGVSKSDLDKLQKLIDALKDELDSLGVRVTNLEDSLDALDKRTKFAQSLSMHGTLLPNVTFRQRPQIQRTITNTTGAAVTTYYGVAVAPGRTNSIDPFVNAFMTSDDSNSPLTQAGSGIQIRQDSRFSLAYAVNENLTVSFPVHILNFEYGGAYSQQAKVDIQPGIDINVARTGAIQNLNIKFGIIDNMKPSRLGLAFRPPFGEGASVPYEEPFQPYQKGMSISGTVLGLTDFYLSFTRLDQVLIDTQTGVTPPDIGVLGVNTYLFPIVAPQIGYTQTGPGGALTNNTFNAGTGSLSQIFLTRKAITGSVFVSAYAGCTYNDTGTATSGAGCPAAPAFLYNDAYNSVVFSPPLPAGSTVTISYRSQAITNNTNFQRYMINARVNQKIKGFPGAELGVTFNRIYDFDDLMTTGDLTQVFQAPASGNGAVSDTVLGVDFQLPIPYAVSGPGSYPVLFGEAAYSKFTPDFRTVPATTDSAGVIGLRLKVAKIEGTIQYQSVGPGFLDGAPFKYYGNPPPLFAFYKGTFFPDFYGFGNNIGINTQFDNSLNPQLAAFGRPASNVAGNPNLTFVYPVFNPFKGAGPSFFQAFTPNTRGVTVNLTAPIIIGDETFNTRASYQHLEELRPNSLGGLLFGPGFASTVRAQFDTGTLGTQFTFPAFGQKLSVNLSTTWERLRRPDLTPFQYYPFNPTTQSLDAGAFQSAQFAFPSPGAGTYPTGSQVSFFPNNINMRHLTVNAAASVPLTQNLGLNFSYSTQRFGGEYGTTATQNISQRKDYYQGNITYSIPKTTAAINFQARNYNYRDDVIPNFNVNQNRQDVNFSIRF